jgi:hypothetical protein
MISKQPTIDDIYNFDAYISTPGVREGLMQRATLDDPEFTLEDTDDGQAMYFNTPHGEQVFVGMPEQTMPGRQEGDVMLAAGPSGTVSDAGATIGPTPRNPVMGGVADFVRGVRDLANEYEIKQFVPLLGGMGVGDLLMGKSPEELEEWAYGNAPMRVPEMTSVPMIKTGRKEQLADTMFLGMDAAGLGKGAGIAARTTAKKLGPKAGQMISKSMEKLGTPLQMNIVESAPQLAIDRVPGVKPGDELIVQHNLTAANLLKADKLGGLPVPSLAISKVGAPLENFGEITLIAPKEMATPSAKNPVFRSDAYTPRFPTIDYSIDAKGEKSLRTMLSDAAEKLPRGDYEIDRLLNNWNDRKYSDVLKAKFLDQRGELPNKADFKESWQFNSELNNLVGQRDAEYQDWLAKFDESLPDNGVSVKERIFKGYTYSGNRRYAAATLDNIVKEMKGGAGGENFNYGVGNLRAVATPKFRTLNQIKVSRGNIVSRDKMESVKNQAQEAYIDLLNRMRLIDKNYSSEDALLELAQSKRMSTLDRLYEDKLPDELKADIGIFLNKIQELPTEYFEMKPQRAVSLEEFKGAIIPKDTPQKARDVLKKAGITEIHEYSTPEERKGLFDKFGKEMFAIMPAAPIGAATMQDKEQK